MNIFIKFCSVLIKMPFWKNMAEVMDEVLDNVHSVTNLAKYVHFY